MPTAINPGVPLPVLLSDLRSARGRAVGYPEGVGIHALPCGLADSVNTGSVE